MFVPAEAVAGAVFVIARSARRCTVVVAVAVLFPGVGSVSFPLTLAVLLRVAPSAVVAGMPTTIVIVALALGASVPMVQVTVPLAWVQVPWVEVAETNVTPVGRVSVAVTPVACEGPLLVTTRV